MERKLKILAVLLLGAGIGALTPGRSRSNTEHWQTRRRLVKSERKVLYWFDPMAPQQHFAKPCKCPSWTWIWCQVRPTRATKCAAHRPAHRPKPGRAQCPGGHGATGAAHRQRGLCGRGREPRRGGAARAAG